MIYTKTDETLLKIDHVSLSFGETQVLRDVCATVANVTRPDCAQGQVICFLGPSGIGKSQLSRIIAGLTTPTAGEVLIPQDGTLQPVRKGLVGMVPQDYPLFEFTTVLQNILIAGRQAGLSSADSLSKASALLDRFELASYAAHYPRALSGGTRQRVAIIRQLMCSEHFLVMDEPFSGLDPTMKMAACELITQVSTQDELNTIIIVTHDICEGLSVADTVWLMGKEAGLPGARLVDEIDLAAMDLCWQRDIASNPRFQALVGDIKARFRTLNQPYWGR